MYGIQQAATSAHTTTRRTEWPDLCYGRREEWVGQRALTPDVPVTLTQICPPGQHLRALPMLQSSPQQLGSKLVVALLMQRLLGQHPSLPQHTCAHAAKSSRCEPCALRSEKVSHKGAT